MGDELINPNTGLPFGATLKPLEKAWKAVTTAPGLTTATGNTPWGSTWGVPTSGVPPIMSMSNSQSNDLAKWWDSDGLFGLKQGQWHNIGQLGQLGIGAFNLWNAYQANKLNKQALAFQKDAWNKQYQNSLGSYLNQYNDILNSRAAMLGLTGDDASTYVDSQLANVENRLKTGTAATTNPNTSASNIRRDLDNDLGA